MEKNFVFLDEMLPGVRWDAQYATWDNFTGKPVDGYKVNRTQIHISIFVLHSGSMKK